MLTWRRAHVLLSGGCQSCSLSSPVPDPTRHHVTEDMSCCGYLDTLPVSQQGSLLAPSRHRQGQSLALITSGFVSNLDCHHYHLPYQRVCGVDSDCECAFSSCVHAFLSPLVAFYSNLPGNLGKITL